MSNDKEKLYQLSTKIDELLVNVNKIAEELRSVSASIKLFAVEQLSQAQTNTTATTTSTVRSTTLSPTFAQASSSQVSSTAGGNSTLTGQFEAKPRTLDDVRMSFPEDLEAKLDFEEKEEYITVKPKQFLGSDNFAKIASAIRGMGGEYISAGKDSHFRVPKKKQVN